MNYHHFTIEERCCLREYYVKGKSYREIARLLGRNVSSVSRELRRNCTFFRDYYLAFDMHVDYSFGDVVLVQCSGIDWYWPGKVVNFNNISFRNGSERVTHSLTMVRDGEYFYCAVDGNWFACYKISGFLAETAIGTFTMAQHAIFSEYGYALGDSEVYADMLEEASETVKTVTVF